MFAFSWAVVSAMAVVPNANEQAAAAPARTYLTGAISEFLPPGLVYASKAGGRQGFLNKLIKQFRNSVRLALEGPIVSVARGVGPSCEGHSGGDGRTTWRACLAAG